MTNENRKWWVLAGSTLLYLATTADGLPQGMMLGAGAGREARLLGLAYELEEAVGWPRIHAA